MTAALHHLALRVADPELSARFYERMFGLPIVRSHPDPAGGSRSVWLALGDGVLMLERALRPPGAHDGSAHVLVFTADDLAEAARRLAAAGLEIVDRTEYTLFFHDPDGHRLGLSSYRLAGQ